MSLMCLARFPLLVEAYSQFSHWNGFSPVCVRMCCLIWNGVCMILEQNGQAQEQSPSLIGSFCKMEDFQKTKQLTNLYLIRFIFCASRMMFQNVHLKIAFSIGSIITHCTFIRFFSGMNHLMSFQITRWPKGFGTNSTCPPSIRQKQAHLQNTWDQ